MDDYPSADGASLHYTTTQQKTHITNTREVLYAWHPWYGRQVEVIRDYVRGGQRVCRCQVDSERPLELPAWMLDRAACCRMQVAVHPSVRIADLRLLQDLLNLLGDPNVVKDRHFPSSGSGDADAHETPLQSPTPPLPTAPEDSSVESAFARNSPASASSAGQAPPDNASALQEAKQQSGSKP